MALATQRSARGRSPSRCSFRSACQCASLNLHGRTAEGTRVRTALCADGGLRARAAFRGSSGRQLQARPQMLYRGARGTCCCCVNGGRSGSAARSSALLLSDNGQRRRPGNTRRHPPVAAGRPATTGRLSRCTPPSQRSLRRRRRRGGRRPAVLFFFTLYPVVVHVVSCVAAAVLRTADISYRVL